MQTTEASVLSHWSSQTVPHLPPRQSSTRPSKAMLPPTNRSDPCSQRELGTASSKFNHNNSLFPHLWCQLRHIFINMLWSHVAVQHTYTACMLTHLGRSHLHPHCVHSCVFQFLYDCTRGDSVPFHCIQDHQGGSSPFPDQRILEELGQPLQ